MQWDYLIELYSDTVQVNKQALMVIELQLSGQILGKETDKYYYYTFPPKPNKLTHRTSHAMRLFDWIIFRYSISKSGKIKHW